MPSWRDPKGAAHRLHTGNTSNVGVALMAGSKRCCTHEDEHEAVQVAWPCIWVGVHGMKCSVLGTGFVAWSRATQSSCGSQLTDHDKLIARKDACTHFQ